MSYTLYIKNMVCNRCINVVKDELINHNVNYVKVNLNEIHFDKEISEKIKNKIEKILEKEGFERIENKYQQLINQIKKILIEQIKYENKKMTTSKLLSTTIEINYFTLSKLFSKLEGQTIEKFIIHQKIERAKDLLEQGGFSVTEISYKLNYSSSQHLSRQFKKITGLTPTQFKFYDKNKDGTV